jgi:hypothetical protein
MQLKADIIPLKKYKIAMEMDGTMYHPKSNNQPVAVLAITLPTAESKKQLRMFEETFYEADGAQVPVTEAHLSLFPAHLLKC